MNPNYQKLAIWAALLVLLVLSVTVGGTTMSPAAVWDALVNPSDGFDQFAIRDFRLPRTIVGLVVGALVIAPIAVCAWVSTRDSTVSF